MTRSTAFFLAAALVHLLSGCVGLPLRGSAPTVPSILHPQAYRSSGNVLLQPRHAREGRPLSAPLLLEPGDWIETGATGKIEILLPQAALRLFSDTRLQLLYAFVDRVALADEVRVEVGEVLVARSTGTAAFTVKTPGMHVEIPSGAVVLVGSRDGVHRAVCYRGQAEARNVRVRGQTVVRLAPGQTLTIDDENTLAFLEETNRPSDWQRWEEPTILTAGVLPVPAPGPTTQ